jgi:hypothetical protein
MNRLQGEDRPTYILGYPRWVRLSRIGGTVLLVGAVLVRLVLAWVHLVRPLLAAVQATSGDPAEIGQALSQALAAQPLRPFLSVHLSLILVAGALAFLRAILPDLALADEGLAVRSLGGWRVIPWASVRVVRIMSFAKPERRLVLVQGNWTRWSPWPRLVSVCLGAGLDPGLLFTSQIRDFKPLMLRLYREVKQAAPEALFDDEFLSPTAALALEPTPTLADLVDQAREEGWALSISAQVMGAVAAGLIVVQLLVLLLQGGAWWKPLVIIALCGMEWLIGTFYLYALSEFFPAFVGFRESALLYPPPQIPRALLAVPMAMLVAAGLPFLAAMVGLAGVLWAVTVTALLVQRLYRLDSILYALAGGAFQAMFQFLVLGVIFTG